MIIPDGMIAKVAGSNQFKVGDGIHSWSQLAFMAPVTTGKGLTTASDGSLTIDFVTMEKDNKELFNGMLKSIKVPIWLTANTNFYVNGTTGSDTLSEGRGLSPSTPFKSIQACVNYVCDTYNLSRFNVYIYIAAGTYAESLSFGQYTTMSGQIYLFGISTGSTHSVIIKNNPKVLEIHTINVIDGLYWFYHIKFEFEYDVNVWAGRQCFSRIMYIGNTTVYLNQCGFEWKATAAAKSTTAGTEVYAEGIIRMQSGAGLSIYAPAGGENWNYIKLPSSDTFSYVYTVVFSVDYASKVILNRGAQSTYNFGVAGRFDAFMMCIRASSVSIMGTGSAWNWTVLPNKTVVGKRYALATNSSISTGGLGENYFPGTVAGTVASYSTYA